ILGMGLEIALVLLGPLHTRRLLCHHLILLRFYQLSNIKTMAAQSGAKRLPRLLVRLWSARAAPTARRIRWRAAQEARARNPEPQKRIACHRHRDPYQKAIATRRQDVTEAIFRRAMWCA